MNEDQLIEELSKKFPVFGRARVGIGDDAAVLKEPGEYVVTTDMLMDRVDFDCAVHAPELIARKAIAVNLSDIAAMGACPTVALISVALPKSTSDRWLRAFQEGLIMICREFSVEVVGGDTNAWQGPLVISVCIHGGTAGRAPVLRNGAKNGDWIMVSGKLGGSIYGRQFSFTPRVALGIALAEQKMARAMMDLSDGVASDLPRLCKASGVGAILDETEIPIHDDIRLRHPQSEWVRHALCDGEDFELMFTCSPADGRRLLDGALSGFGDFYHIGVITEPGTSIRIKGADRSIHELGWKGYMHSWS